MPLASRIITQITGDYTSALTLETPTSSLAYSVQTDFATGAGAGQADTRYSATRTLAPSATENLDLAGVLIGPFGVALTFARIKCVYFRAAPANTNDVQVTRPATNGVPLFTAVSSGLALPPGGWFSWGAPSAAGVVVTPATGDLITVTNGGAGTSITYDVIIIGAGT